MPVSAEQRANGFRSITEILDAYQEPGIVAWKLRVGAAKAKKISEEALAIGTEVDLLIRNDIQGKGYQLDGRRAEVVSCLRAWEKFKQKYPKYMAGIEDIQIELTKDGLVGHPDIAHRLEINDIKSGNSLSLKPKYCVQSSKYALMAGKTRAAILMLSKSTENFMYIYWENELVDYFGGTVFEAFKIIYDYESVVRDMVRDYLEKETLNVS